MAINDRVAQLLSRDLATNALGVLMVVFFAAVLFQYDAVLTLVGIAVVSLNVVALRFVSRKRVDGNRRLSQDQGKLLGTAIGGLQTIETLKATGGESDLFARWAGYQAKVVNGRQELERYTQILDAVPPLLSAVNTALILGLGGLRVMNGSLSLGGLVAFQLLMAAFIAPDQPPGEPRRPAADGRGGHEPARRRPALPDRPAAPAAAPGSRRPRGPPSACTASWSCATSPSATAGSIRR